MEFGEFNSFEAGSLTYTSVIVLLPLGSLIAQNVSRADSYTLRSDKSGGSASTSASRSTRDCDGVHGVGGAYSRAATKNAIASKASKNDFGTWSHTSDSSTASAIKGSVSTQVNIQSGNCHHQCGSNLGVDKSHSNSPAMSCIEKQMQDIHTAPKPQEAGRVWVDHEVEVRQDLV